MKEAILCTILLSNSLNFYFAQNKFFQPYDEFYNFQAQLKKLNLYGGKQKES